MNDFDESAHAAVVVQNAFSQSILLNMFSICLQYIHSVPSRGFVKPRWGLIKGYFGFSKQDPREMPAPVYLFE